MAILPIVVHPSPLLTERCKVVKKFDEELIELLNNMYDTMIAADGVGLAAPQVGKLLRVAIVDLGEGQEVIEMINPVVTAIGGRATEIEGCLSFPGLYGEVERPYFVRIEAQERDGSLYELEAEDYEARAILHEIDHLDGILFTEKIIRVVDPEEFEAEFEEGEEE